MTLHLKETAARGAATEPPPARPPVITWDIGPDGNRSPYPGLMHFTRFYAPVFFGREAEVRRILDRLQARGIRFLLVSGDSGVGKSSVVDAGVLPGWRRTVCREAKAAAACGWSPARAGIPSRPWRWR
ncbi:MAG: ATP-binding protein [Desulfobacteraceae bacterium]|nr:ATP-binding protein [Desulfobacteraceae bacterium]